MDATDKWKHLSKLIGNRLSIVYFARSKYIDVKDEYRIIQKNSDMPDRKEDSGLGVPHSTHSDLVHYCVQFSTFFIVTRVILTCSTVFSRFSWGVRVKLA